MASSTSTSSVDSPPHYTQQSPEETESEEEEIAPPSSQGARGIKRTRFPKKQSNKRTKRPKTEFSADLESEIAGWLENHPMFWDLKHKDYK